MIPNQTIADLMVTALEGGSNYWLNAINPRFKTFAEYSEPEAYGPDMTPRMVYDDDGPTPYKLDWPSIERGVKTMYAKYPHHFGDILNDNMDADTADVFLQCVLYDDVIFG